MYVCVTASRISVVQVRYLKRVKCKHQHQCKVLLYCNSHCTVCCLSELKCCAARNVQFCCDRYGFRLYAVAVVGTPVCNMKYLRYRDVDLSSL